MELSHKSGTCRRLAYSVTLQQFFETVLLVLTLGMAHLHSRFSVKYSQVSLPSTTELANMGVHEPAMFADAPASPQILNLVDGASGNK